MGFINREVNRKALIKANNDVSEAVTLLTNYNYFDEYENDVHLSNESALLISPPAKDSFEQQQQQQQTVKTEEKNMTQKKEDKKRRKKRKINCRFLFLTFGLISFRRLRGYGAS